MKNILNKNCLWEIVKCKINNREWKRFITIKIQVVKNFLDRISCYENNN